MIAEVPRIVDAAQSITAEAGVFTAIEPATIAEARASAGEAAGVKPAKAPATEPAEPPTVEAAKSAVKTPAPAKSTAECRRPFDAARKAHGASTCQ